MTNFNPWLEGIVFDARYINEETVVVTTYLKPEWRITEAVVDHDGEAVHMTFKKQ